MYGLIQTHKECNSARKITNGWGAAVEFLNVFVEYYLYKVVNKIDSRIKDTPDMLNIIDNVNSSHIFTKDSVLVTFDVVNMFPSIDVLSLEEVSEIMHNWESAFLTGWVHPWCPQTFPRRQ